VKLRNHLICFGENIPILVQNLKSSEQNFKLKYIFCEEYKMREDATNDSTIHGQLWSV
jgi:tRNA splicing ligase